MRASRDFIRNGRVSTIESLFARPLSECGSKLRWMGPCPGVDTNVEDSQSGRPCTFQLVDWQMPVCRLEAFPARLHRIYFAAFDDVRIVEVVRNLQLSQIYRSCIFCPLTKRHIGLLPRRLNDLVVFPAGLFATLTDLSSSVGVPVGGALQLPGSIGAVRYVLILRAC